MLDLGCGSGAPVVRDLVAAGHHVTGVDISEVQIQQAQKLVPQADFIMADATSVDFPGGSFDAVVSLYALIHIPQDEQLPLLERIATWLRPGGWFLCSTGQHEWTGMDENWLDSGVAMWWSHADADTDRAWITRAGLTVEQEEFAPEGGRRACAVLGTTSAVTEQASGIRQPAGGRANPQRVRPRPGPRTGPIPNVTGGGHT
ncbi:class I SAM-dependent methyltransferase [Streptomyces sp. NPDC029041]|uniref:class I SAM-dependent methyltransferase n=1 Tax=Streptomyces sp. NPDC029041 TaxID=3155727 RepID=UPI0033CE8822